MTVAMAPRAILRRKTPRALRQLRQLRQRLAIDGLVRDIDVDAFDRHAQQLGIIDLLAPLPPSTLTSTSRAPATATHVALLQNGVRGGFLDLAVTADPLHEDACVGHQRFGFGGPQAHRRPPGCTRNARSSQRCQAEPAPPSTLLPPCRSS